MISKLTGIVTALEVQTHALLLANIKAGVHPDVVLQALKVVPAPNLPAAARNAYNHAIAGFRQRLDEAASESLPRHGADRENGGIKGEKTDTGISGVSPSWSQAELDPISERVRRVHRRFRLAQRATTATGALLALVIVGTIAARLPNLGMALDWRFAIPSVLLVLVVAVLPWAVVEVLWRRSSWREWYERGEMEH